MEDKRVIDFITTSAGILESVTIGDTTAYMIDRIPTIIDSTRGKIAHCRIVLPDNTFKKCYVVKYEDCYAHGENLKQAFLDAQHKSFVKFSVEDRIHEFMSLFPSLETIVSNTILFEWHNKLTGSCELGRKLLVEKLGLTTGESTIKDFIKISKGNFGENIIQKLELAYLAVS